MSVTPAPVLRAWHRDPVLWLAAVLGVAATAYALFAGRYLPYIDWSNHLGLISVLAHGGSTGALDYLERSFAPSPYLLFYAVTALFAQAVTVDVAAKLSILASTALFVPAVASLAEATGRNPRVAAIAPLAVFGVSMGYGFGSFVFATPFLFASLAAAERLLFAPRERRLRSAGWLALWLVLTFCAHGFLFLCTALLLFLRTMLRAAAVMRAEGLRAGAVPVVLIGTSAVPAVLAALPSTLRQIAQPEIEAGSEQPEGGPLLHFVSWAEHRVQLGGHLLERGSAQHWWVMYGAAALLGLLLAGALLQRLRRTTPAQSRTFAPELYAGLLVLLFLAGPMSVEWPSSIWFVYPRFGVIAAVALFLLPRVELPRVASVAFVVLALGLVGWNARLNAQHIRNFSQWASAYDPVRAEIPRGARVLALTVVGGGDLTQRHPALGSLYFYHLVDGASYTAFLFDKASLPVHSKSDVAQPRAPFWRAPGSFDPRTHGVDFDYLVLRGSGLVSKTRSAGLHELVREVDGWSVFRTLAPSPRPSR